MMGEKVNRVKQITATIACLIILTVAPTGDAAAQNFDFESLNKKTEQFIVIMDMKMEISFGIQTNEQKQRMLGTIVSEDGLVIFDGSFLWNDNLFSAVSGITIKTTPIELSVTTLGGEEYKAEYIGVDRFTQLGFAKIVGADLKFHPVKFESNYTFTVGSWVALYMLLPDFVEPPIGADIGMISTIVEAPEKFALTVGFGPPEVSSVLFDSKGNIVGVLGNLMDPSQANADASGMIESFGGSSIPLLGVITGERLERLIANPPRKGETDRAWLGISLQALTPDISEFLGLGEGGGIIVNDVIPQSPAFKAGLRTGDVIRRVNGEIVPVDDEEKVPIFQRQIAEMGPGTSVEFSVYRPSGETTDSLTVLATLEAAPIAAADAPEIENEFLEMKFRDLVFSDYMAYNLDHETFAGVVVSELKPGGPAWVGGLRIGDIIQKINSRSVAAISDVSEVMSELEADRPGEIIFFVWRISKTLFVNVKTDWP